MLLRSLLCSAVMNMDSLVGLEEARLDKPTHINIPTGKSEPALMNKCLPVFSMEIPGLVP